MGFLVLGDLKCCGSEMAGWVCGVYNAESILTMPVVTVLFRNLFDNIFTIFYGCWTVFNGVGPVTHPDHTIWSSVQKVDSVLNRTATRDRPRSTVPTSLCPPCCTLCMYCVCARVACALCVCVCSMYVCMCACACV